MLNNKYSTLDEIGNLLVAKLKEGKKDFFNSDIFVFPNAIMEQWFKAYWLKHEKGVLMNVEFTRMSSLIYNAFGNNKKEILSLDTYKNLILMHLMKDQSVLPDTIKNYLKNQDGSVNNINLYDFSNTMAKLFIKYEKMNTLSTIKESWQYKLYNEVNTDPYTNLYKLSKRNSHLNGKNIFILGFMEIEPLYKDFIDELAKDNNVQILSLNSDETKGTEIKKIGAAPSKQREVEFVHTEICKLLNKDARFSDIVVVCPDLEGYASAIAKVFKQNEEKGYYDIPYVLCGKSNTSGHVGEALQVLFDIIRKKDFTRKDFYSLVTNRTIMKVRKIKQESIDAWSKSILNMNVYRNNTLPNDGKDDEWEFAKNRMLLSVFIGGNFSVDNMISLGDNTYLPFTDMDLSRDDIATFCKLVQDLQELLIKFKDKKDLTQDDLVKLGECLDSWLSVKDDDNEEGNFFYKDVVNTLDLWGNKIGADKVSTDIIFAALLDAAKLSMSSSAGVLTQGVTFIPYDKNTILTADYIFFMGMSSNNLPRTSVKSSLDLSIDTYTTQEIDTYIHKVLSNNATKAVYYSYVNMNLKSGEEFFQSPLIPKTAPEAEKLTIDETRDFGSLYTRSEINRKAYFDGLDAQQNKETSTETEEIRQAIQKETQENAPKVKMSDIASYLKEPVAFKIKYLLGKYEEYDYDDIAEEYESISQETLDAYAIKKEILTKMLVNMPLDPVVSDSLYQNILVKYQILHKLPYLNYLKVFNDAFSSARKYYEKIRNEIGEYDPKIILLSDVEIANASSKWILTTKEEFFVADEDDDIYVYDIKVTDIDVPHKFLGMYVFALGYLAGLINDDPARERKIHLRNAAEFTITPETAVSYLNEFYTRMFDFKDKKIVPVDLYKIFNEIETYDDLVKKVTDPYHGLWLNFDEKYIVNAYQYNGYTDFNNEWNEEWENRDRWLPFLKECFKSKKGEQGE